MADFGKILEQAQQMQARMKQMQSELEKQTVTAAAGGGMVTVQVTDIGGLTFDKVLTIALTNVNETPTNIALSNASVAENSANGTSSIAVSRPI